MAYTPYGYNPYQYNPGFYQPPVAQPMQPAMANQPVMQNGMQGQAVNQPMQNNMGQAQNPAPTASGIIWCQGEEGAKSYMVAPGNSVLLMDSENTVFYIKSVDSSGMPLPLRVFDYTERVQGANPMQRQAAQPAVRMPDLSGYVPRDEFDTLAERFDALAAKLDSMTARPVAKTARAKKEEVDNGEPAL